MGNRWTRTIMILILANIAFFIVQLLFSSLTNLGMTNIEPTPPNELDVTPIQPWYYPAHDIFTKLFWLYPPDTFGNFWIWQLVTYMFLHSINDPWHLIFNMLVLWMFGTEVERAMGTRRFLSLYFTAGIFAGICSCIFTPHNPILGASGAIFAIEVAFAMYFPNSIVIFFFFPMKAKYLVMLFAGFTVLNCLIPKEGNVAYFAHLGGLIYGFLFVRYSSSINELFRLWLSRRQKRRLAENEYLQEGVDRILGKVHREGMASLTRKERAFLKYASKIYKKNRESIK